MTGTSATHNRRRLWLVRGVSCAMILFLAGLLSGQLGRAIVLLDLANIITVPLAWGVIVCAALLIGLTRRPVARGLCLLSLGWAAYMLVPPADSVGDCPSGGSVRIAWLNLQSSDRPEPIITWLKQEQPDIVGFGELHAGVAQTRNAIAALYPHSQSCLASARCSTILYARTKPASSQPLSRGNVQNRRSLSAAEMTLTANDGSSLNVIAVHLSRPPHMARQREELSRLQSIIDDPANTVLIGDFNLTRRMHALQDFAQRTGFMSNPSDRATWPVWDGPEWHRAVTPGPMIQIDHVLTGRNWRTAPLRTSDDLGSDHRGIVTDICRAS